MSYPLSVRRENELLARELGYEFGNQRYCWAWSEDLVMPMIMLTEENRIEYDYHCACGINVSAHNAACEFSVPRAKWEMRKLAPRLQDQWVMCRWMKPECAQADWEHMFGSVPYPAGGYRVPIGDTGKTIALKPGQTPYRQTTELIIRHIKEHFTKTGKQRNEETRDNWKANEIKQEEEYRLRCIDAFPVHTGFPGDKEEWSQGGMPDVPSPNLRPKSDIVIASA
jgi:hypothetical protein